MHLLSKENLNQIWKDNNIDGSQVCLVDRTMRQEVQNWCDQFSISVHYVGSLYASYDVWKILKEDHMMWFRLKWE